MKKEIFYKDPCLVIYVPGYLSGDDNQEEVISQLERLYECDKHEYGDPHVVVFNWESVASYARAIHNSYAAADDLIDYLQDITCTPDVTVIGHSLGALVVANAFKKIQKNVYYRAKQVILLGAAIDAHTNLKHMCEVTDYPVINVVNPNDVVLSTIYKTFNESPALGCKGSYCKHNNNYVELEILPRAAQLQSPKDIQDFGNQLLDVTGHSSGRVYLDSLIRGNYRCR